MNDVNQKAHDWFQDEFRGQDEMLEAASDLREQ